MASDDNNAASAGGSGTDNDWESLLRDAKPDDMEELYLYIALHRSRLDPGGSGSSGSAPFPVAR